MEYSIDKWISDPGQQNHLGKISFAAKYQDTH